MGVIHNIIAGRTGAPLALDFGAETITLLAEDVQAPQGWSPLTSASLADDDFSDQVEAMRAVAAEHSGDAAVDLWLPEDQILNTHLELKSAQIWNRVSLAKTALAERVGVSPEDINIDLARAPGDVWAICAVEAKVVEEAQDYARRWGFAPHMVTTRHADAAFAAPPNLTGEANRRPLMLGAGAAAAAAACVVAAVLAWPSSEAPPLAQGPERIAMAPAAVQFSSPSVEVDAIAVPNQTSNAAPIVLPASPEPDYQTMAANSDKEAEKDYDFAASILSPAPQFPSFLSVDFSLPRAETATPIYANVAYQAPALGHSTPTVEAIEQYFSDEEPVIGSAASLSIDLDEIDDATSTPSELGSFDVAALGPSPQALRTEDLILQSEAPAAIEEAGKEEAEAAEEAETEPSPAEAATEVEADDAEEGTTQAERSPIVQNATDPREAARSANEEDEADTPGPGSVASAPQPGKRPDSIDMTAGPGAVAAAPLATSRPKSIKPKATAVARNTSSAKSVRAPKRGKPTGRGLANVATLKGAITLDQTSLLGVFGTSKNRRALLRMSDGRMKRVSQGEVIDGWVISRIQATSMRMTRGAEVRNLQLIR